MIAFLADCFLWACVVLYSTCALLMGGFVLLVARFVVTSIVRRFTP